MVRHCGPLFFGACDDKCINEDTVAYLAGWLIRGVVQLHRGIRFRDEHIARRQVPGKCWYDAGSDRSLSKNAELDDVCLGGRGFWGLTGFDPLAATQETGIARLHCVAGCISREHPLHLRSHKRGRRYGSADGDHERCHRGAVGFLQLVFAGHGSTGRTPVTDVGVQLLGTTDIPKPIGLPRVTYLLLDGREPGSPNEKISINLPRGGST